MVTCPIVNPKETKAAGLTPQTLPQLSAGVGAGVGSRSLSSSTHTAFGHPAARLAKYRYVPSRNNAALNKTPRPTWLRTKPVTSGLPLLQLMVLSMVCSRVDGVCVRQGRGVGAFLLARQPRAAALLPGAREAPNDSEQARPGTHGTSRLPKLGLPRHP